jgi:hypothetical protein
MNTQLISRQRNWQPKPTKNLVTSVPVKEGLKLEKIKHAEQKHQTLSENIQDSNARGFIKKPEHTNSWKDIEGLSWMLLDDVEDY